MSEFVNLLTFIHEFSSGEENADVLKFMKIGYRRNQYEVISI